MLPWMNHLLYAYPPVPLLNKVNLTALVANQLESSPTSTPRLKSFLIGLWNTFPDRRLIPPQWSLPLVLQRLMCLPFEPMATCELLLLTFKMAFLLAITLARRAGELCALQCDPPYLQFYKDKVLAYPDISFLPKVVSSFHLSLPISLPTFFLNPTTPLERHLHSLDVRHSLAFYTSRISPFTSTQKLQTASSSSPQSAFYQSDGLFSGLFQGHSPRRHQQFDDLVYSDHLCEALQDGHPYEVHHSLWESRPFLCDGMSLHHPGSSTFMQGRLGNPSVRLHEGPLKEAPLQITLKGLSLSRRQKNPCLLRLLYHVLLKIHSLRQKSELRLSGKEEHMHWEKETLPDPSLVSHRTTTPSGPPITFWIHLHTQRFIFLNYFLFFAQFTFQLTVTRAGDVKSLADAVTGIHQEPQKQYNSYEKHDKDQTSADPGGLLKAAVGFEGHNQFTLMLDEPETTKPLF
ncbi:hypothetical protein JRQ81_003185 [Phrynocephalus forsythii]|uniref:Uncharacterized protein n=1 Tax=Phrynocephalus forsythii TaxID=171643 RepID=A0A9Q1AXD8_9SAUR|nr:hypothetical protein JRQ81_003185 [Phrynocephalus forsythii]